MANLSLERKIRETLGYIPPFPISEYMKRNYIARICPVIRPLVIYISINESLKNGTNINTMLGGNRFNYTGKGPSRCLKERTNNG